MKILARWRGWAPELLSVFRIVTAYMFLQYGTAKLFAFPGPLMPDGGTAPLASLAGVASAIELVGGALLLGSSGGVVFQPLLGRSADVWGYPASYVCSAAVQSLAVPFLWLARREGAGSDAISDDPAKE